MREIPFSRIVLALIGAALWGRAIASPSFSDSVILEIAMALLGSMFLAWLIQSWLSVIVIPAGYILGMYFVRARSPESVDISLVEAVLFVLLAIIGPAVGTLLIHRRRGGAPAG